jgi:hypothetical protein
MVACGGPGSGDGSLDSPPAQDARQSGPDSSGIDGSAPPTDAPLITVDVPDPVDVTVGIDVASPSDSGMLDAQSAMDAVSMVDARAGMDAVSMVDARSGMDVLAMADTSSPADARPMVDVVAPSDVAVLPPVVLPAYFASLRTAQLWAVVQDAPASITLRWATVMGRTVTAVAIDRKPLAGGSWGAAVATPAAGASQWTDTNVTPGELYEYRVRLTTSSGAVTGYVVSGVRAVIDGYQGRIAIVVDSSLQPMLAAELATLQDDLYGDGWIPVVVSVGRAATPASVRSALVSLRASSPDLRAAYLLGHVPVAYAGNNNPDGHASRIMSADGYYGELTSTWNGGAGCTNNPQQAVLTDAPTAMNTFCNADFPSTLELEVGRVDMSNLPTFTAGELASLRAYLAKAHAFKIRARSATVRGFIKDRLGDVGLLTGAGAWSTYAALVGPSNITVDNRNTTFSYNILDGQSHAFAFGSNYGADCTGSLNGLVGSTATVATTSWGAAFNHTIGSYFGEFNCRDSFLRGLLASGDALSNAYNALQWFFHPMAMGQTLGFTALRTMNNKVTMLYAPLGSCIASAANSHLGLMGDPSLRMQYILPPTALALSNVGGQVEARWTASAEPGIDGYHVYQVTAAGHTRLTTTPVTATRWTSAVAYAPGLRFVVRAIKLTTTSSGSYLLPSVGAVARTP